MHMSQQVGKETPPTTIGTKQAAVYLPLPGCRAAAFAAAFPALTVHLKWLPQSSFAKTWTTIAVVVER